MGLGLMNKPAKLCIEESIIDSEGFNRRIFFTVSNIRVFVEERHGSERWANFAAFSEATHLFRFRIVPGVFVSTAHYILFLNARYNILSVENVKGRGMYIEVLAKKVESSNG